ncbi:MAG: ATP-binding protein [Solirubrobacteraceae bacterium]
MPRTYSSGILVEVDPATSGVFRLSLRAVAENVAVVRQALTGMTEALGIGPGVLADMKTAVSEACNNVVLHAYEDGGPVEVFAVARNGDVAVTVRDHGRGITPEEADLDTEHDGVGLSLITALTAGVEIDGAAGEGTEVRMRFVPDEDDVAHDPEVPQPGIGPLLAGVLGRTVAMLAARANFSLDRLSDAQLVSDAVAAHALGHAADGPLRVAVDDTERHLEIYVGPLQTNGGQGVVNASDLPGVGLLLEQLVDDVAVERDGDLETLVLRIAERRLR